MKCLFFALLINALAIGLAYPQEALVYHFGEAKSAHAFKRAPQPGEIEGIYQPTTGSRDNCLAILRSPTPGRYIVQLKEYVPDQRDQLGARGGLVLRFRTFEDCELRGGQLVGQGIRCEWATSPEGTPGLLVHWPEYSEFGKRQGNLATSGAAYWSGLYPDASRRLLAPADLRQRTRAQLQVMRGEVLARYQLAFAPGSELGKYFARQKWYQPLHPSVDAMLTSLERANLKLIEAAEGKK
jgi:hypothetical protein